MCRVQDGVSSRDGSVRVRALIGLSAAVFLTSVISFSGGAEPVDLAPSQSDNVREISPLASGDRAQLDRQRSAVSELAVRHFGSGLHHSRADLSALQRIIDEGLLSRDQTGELQSLGVVLGDVMTRELGLAWVVVKDERGRSHALRYDDTDNLIFPVTMISKRFEWKEPVDVRALFDEVEAMVKQLAAIGAADRP